MSDERIDVVLTDKVSDSPAKKLRDLGAAAEGAHVHVTKLKEQLAGINASSVRKLQQELTRATIEQTKQTTALERQRAATARAETAVARLQTENERLARAQQQTALSAQRVTTEQERTAKATALLMRAIDGGTASLQRNARASEQAGDAAVKSYWKQREAQANAAARASRRPVREEIVGNDMVQEYRNRQASIAKYARETEQAERAAAKLARQNAALAASQARVNGEFTNGQKAFQRLTIQYTVNDVVASLASGASPFTILAQQGGQVTQAWGGLIPTLKAAAGVIFSTTGAIVGMVAVGLGFIAFIDSANKELKDLQRQLDLTNGSAGLTASGFIVMGNTIADATNKSIASSREIAIAYASSGQLQRQQIQELSIATQNFAKQSGQDTDEVVKNWSKLIEQPAKFAREFTTQYNIMSPAQYEHIRRLEEEGRKTEAVAAASRLLYEYYGKEVPRSLGFVESAWNKVGKSISDAITRLRDWGREQTVAEKRATILARIAEIQNVVNRTDVPATEKEVALAKRLVAEENEKLTALTLQQRSQDRAADAAAAQTVANREAIEAAEHLRSVSESIADNWRKGETAVQKFRRALEKADPNDPNTIQSRKNQKAIEQGIRDKFNPKAAAAAKKATREQEAAEESYAKVLERTTAQLNKEIESYGLIDDEREKSRKMADIEIAFLKTKQGLQDKDRTALSRLLDMQIAGADVQRALMRSYEEAQGPMRIFDAEQRAINLAMAKGYISADQMTAQLARSADQYQQAIDPLYQFKKQMEEQAATTGKVGDAVQIEAMAYQTRAAALQRGQTINDAELTWAKDKLRVSLEQARVDAENQRLYAQSTEQRGKDFSRTLTGINNPANKQTQGDKYGAAAAATSIPGLYDGTAEAMTQNVERHAEMYRQLDALKAADLVSEQTYQTNKLRIQMSAQQLSIGTAKGFFGELEGLQKSRSKTAQRLGKAAAIANATISTYEGAQKAYTSMVGIPYVGPYLAVAAAAAAIGVGLANIQAIRSAPTGYMTGGYTGNGPVSEVAGVVHRREMVWDARTTAQYLPILDAMQKGGSAMANSGGAVRSGGNSRPMNVNIRQEPGVAVEVVGMDENGVEVVARRILNKEGPGMVAGQFSRPNSKGAKSLKRNTKTQWTY